MARRNQSRAWGGLPLVVIGLGDVPHGGRPLVLPGGGGHGQVALQGADAVVPPAVEQVLPAQVVHVPVVLRLLPHRQLQQGQILGPGLVGVGVVVQLDPLRRHLGAAQPVPRPPEHLVDRVDPPPAAAGVDLVGPEHHPLRPVGVEGPGVPVGGPAHSRGPGPLQGGRQPGRNTSSKSVHTHTSASSGTRSRDRFRAASNRQGTTVSTVTAAPRARSFSAVPSVEPVSSTTTWSASDMESIHRPQTAPRPCRWHRPRSSRGFPPFHSSIGFPQLGGRLAGGHMGPPLRRRGQSPALHNPHHRRGAQCAPGPLVKGGCHRREAVTGGFR